MPPCPMRCSPPPLSPKRPPAQPSPPLPPSPKPPRSPLPKSPPHPLLSPPPRLPSPSPSPSQEAYDRCLVTANGQQYTTGVDFGVLNMTCPTGMVVQVMCTFYGECDRICKTRCALLQSSTPKRRAVYESLCNSAGNNVTNCLCPYTDNLAVTSSRCNGLSSCSTVVIPNGKRSQMSSPAQSSLETNHDLVPYMQITMLVQIIPAVSAQLTLVILLPRQVNGVLYVINIIYGYMVYACFGSGWELGILIWTAACDT